MRNIEVLEAHYAMKPKLKTLALLLLGISVTMQACTTDDISPSKEKEFCSSVQNENWEETISIMNNHLQSFRSNDDSALERFEFWLNNLDCVTNATILCNSCMFSEPPQSAIQLILSARGQDIEMTMHILMSEKLKVLSLIEVQ